MAAGVGRSTCKGGGAGEKHLGQGTAVEGDAGLRVGLMAEGRRKGVGAGPLRQSRNSTKNLRGLSGMCSDTPHRWHPPHAALIRRVNRLYRSVKIHVVQHGEGLQCELSLR
jgi:hypothetical protein